MQEARGRRITNSRSDWNPGSKRQTGCRGGSELGAYIYSSWRSLEFSSAKPTNSGSQPPVIPDQQQPHMPPPTGILFKSQNNTTNPKPLRKSVHIGSGEMAQSGSVCRANVRPRVLISRAPPPIKKPGPAPSLITVLAKWRMGPLSSLPGWSSWACKRKVHWEVVSK